MSSNDFRSYFAPSAACALSPWRLISLSPRWALGVDAGDASGAAADSANVSFGGEWMCV
jgi:hypothetical protein